MPRWLPEHPQRPWRFAKCCCTAPSMRVLRQPSRHSAARMRFSTNWACASKTAASVNALNTTCVTRMASLCSRNPAGGNVLLVVQAASSLRRRDTAPDREADVDFTDDDLTRFAAQGAVPLPAAAEQGHVAHDGASIWYATFGTGTPVILLHGGLGHGG